MKPTIFKAFQLRGRIPAGSQPNFKSLDSGSYSRLLYFSGEAFKPPTNVYTERCVKDSALIFFVCCVILNSFSVKLFQAETGTLRSSIYWFPTCKFSKIDSKYCREHHQKINGKLKWYQVVTSSINCCFNHRSQRINCQETNS